MRPDESFQLTGPITRERAEKAVEWLVHNAGSVAKAKGQRDRAEHMLKVTKAIEMQKSGEKSAAAQEREALASVNYSHAINDHTDAVIAHETLLGTSKAAATLIDVWRSLNSTLKGAQV